MVNIDISASGNAAAEIAAVQAAIDALHGKTVDVNVRTHGVVGLNRAATALDAFAAAQERHGRASDRAASASERAGAAAGSLGRDVGRAGRSVDGLGGGSQRAGRGLDVFARAGADADRSSRGLGRSVDGVGKGLAGLADGAGGAARGVGGLTRSAADLGVSLGSVSGFAGSAMSSLGTLGRVAAYSAAGSGVLTAAVGALGAVGVGALSAVGVAAGAAGGAMASFAVDAHKDSARFGSTLEQMGKQAHQASQFISEPMAEAIVGMGRAMVTAEGQMTPAGFAIANSLRAGFGEAAGVMNRSSGSIVDSATAAAGGFARLTGEAAPGVEAFLGQMPSLTQGAVSGMSQITSEFGRSAGAIEGATPALNRAMGAAGALGAELVRIGKGSMVPFAEDSASMLRGATAMATQLTPAIRPAMSAFTDTMNAGMGGIGSLAPEIASFAQTLSQNAPQIESVVNSIGRGMLSMGNSAVGAVGMAAPALARFGDAIQGAEGGTTNLLGSALTVAADAATTGVQMVSGTDPASRLGAQHGAALGLNRPGGGITQLGRSVLGTMLMGPLGVMAGFPTASDSQPGGIAGSLGGGGGRTSMPGSVPLPAGGGAQLAASAMGGGPPGVAGPRSPLSTLPTAAPSAGGADLIGAMTAIPSGVAQARSSLSTLPTAAQAAMAGAGQAVGGVNLGGAVSNQVGRMTQTVESAAPAAAGAGAKVGGAIGSGMAQGTSTSMTVVDRIMIKRLQQVEEVSMGAIDAHSPSRRYRTIGGYIPQGLAAGIAERGVDAMNASSRMFADQQAQGDAFRAEAQSATIIKVGRRPESPQQGAASDRGDAALSGVAKQQAFGEDPNNMAGLPRQVFDKQVFGWEAKPGQDITKAKTMDELRGMIQSPLQGPQRTAMESIQGNLDQPGLSRNSQMFGERTQQNIMRNRPGALNVAKVWGDHLAQQKSEAAKLGQNSSDGLLGGIRSRIGGAGVAGGKLAEAGQAGYKKKDRQNSPSAVWSGFGANSVAGLANGMTGSTGLAVGAVSSLSGAMQAPMSDFGLKVGYAYGQSFIDGTTRVMEKAQLKTLGLPSDISDAAMASLAATGLLRAGAGASTWKTAFGGIGTVTLPSAAPAPPQTITIEVQHMEGDRMAGIADQRIELAFDEATNTYQTLRG